MKRDLNIRLEPSRAKGPWQPEPMPAIYSQSIPPLYFWLGADAYPEIKECTFSDYVPRYVYEHRHIAVGTCSLHGWYEAPGGCPTCAILAARSVP